MINQLGWEVQLIALIVLCLCLVAIVLQRSARSRHPPLPPGPPGYPIFGNALPKALYVVLYSFSSLESQPVY